jgi:hypothetical protein
VSDARHADVWSDAALAALGAWTIAVPYLGRAVGLVVNVPSRTEIVDHVVPGTLIGAAGLYLVVLAHRGAPPGWSRLVAAGLCFLAGFWVLATHVPLVGDAINGTAPWDATLWHAATALPVVVVSLMIVLRES